MDMALDNTKARTFECSTCDVRLRALRNCGGKYSPARIKLNDNSYVQCPRSIVFNHQQERFLLDLYSDCREHHVYPFPGSLAQQTAFTRELFEFFDNIVNKYRARKEKEQAREMEKLNKQQNKTR